MTTLKCPSCNIEKNVNQFLKQKKLLKSCYECRKAFTEKKEKEQQLKNIDSSKNSYTCFENYTFDFGMYKGKKLIDLLKSDEKTIIQYLKFCIDANFKDKDFYEYIIKNYQNIIQNGTTNEETKN